jgi:hypothetical protein
MPCQSPSWVLSLTGACISQIYSEKEAAWRGGCKEGAWWRVDKKLVFPQATRWKAVKSIHDTFYLGRDATQELINRMFDVCGDLNKVYSKTG